MTLQWMDTRFHTSKFTLEIVKKHKDVTDEDQLIISYTCSAL